jgi:uncharacterized RDD family membrane protein YckC
VSQFVTGEAVTIDLRVARLGSRLIAGIVDVSLELVVLLMLAWVTFRIVVPDNAALVATLYLLTTVVVLVGYPVTTETLWKGRTVGKAAMGLRVVRDDGGPIRFRHALVRGLLGVVVEKPGALVALPGVISMLISERSKRLGDILAGTVVLQERIPRANTAPVTMPPQLAPWASTLDLSSFGDALALAVRQFLGRLPDLSPEARERIGTELAAFVHAVVTPPPPPGTPGPAYLAAVLAERTARAHQRLAGGPPAWYPGAHQHPGAPVHHDPLRFPQLRSDQQAMVPGPPATRPSPSAQPADTPASGPFTPPN